MGTPVSAEPFARDQSVARCSALFRHDQSSPQRGLKHGFCRRGNDERDRHRAIERGVPDMFRRQSAPSRRLRFGRASPLAGSAKLDAKRCMRQSITTDAPAFLTAEESARADARLKIILGDHPPMMAVMRDSRQAKCNFPFCLTKGNCLTLMECLPSGKTAHCPGFSLDFGWWRLRNTPFGLSGRAFDRRCLRSRLLHRRSCHYPATLQALSRRFECLVRFGQH